MVTTPLSFSRRRVFSNRLLFIMINMIQHDCHTTITWYTPHSNTTEPRRGHVENKIIVLRAHVKLLRAHVQFYASMWSYTCAHKLYVRTSGDETWTLPAWTVLLLLLLLLILNVVRFVSILARSQCQRGSHNSISRRKGIFIQLLVNKRNRLTSILN